MKSTTFLVVVAAFAAAIHSTNAQLITNGGFEAPETPTVTRIMAGEDTIAPWVVGGHSVDVADADDNGFMFGAAYEGEQQLDLNGLGRGQLTQAFATTPGLLYTLTFAYSNVFLNSAPEASAAVRLFDGLGDRLNQTITHFGADASDYKWNVFKGQFTAAQNTTSLEFTSLTDLDGRGGGILLDAVQVVAASQAGEIKIVSPSAYKDIEGPEGGGGGTSPFRFQQVFPAADFAALGNKPHWLVGYTFRPDQSLTSPLTVHFPDNEVRLSTTQRGPGDLSSIFDDNLGPDVMQFYRGRVILATDIDGTSPVPREFYNAEFPAGVTPYLYDPSQGNLLFEAIGWQGISPSTFNDRVPGIQTTLHASSPSATEGELIPAVIFQFTFIPASDADNDNDGMSDSYETANGLNPAVNDAALDKDGDTLTNLTEFQRNTRADKADTDDDGLNDPVETDTGTYVSPTNTGTDPLVADTDGDGLKDSAETNTNVFVSPTNTGTNPFNRDTDGDTLLDGAEVVLGSNPLSAASLASIIEGGGVFSTEHVWTQSNPQLNDTAGAEAVLDDPSMFPPEDSITVDTKYIHFHDNVAPPWFVPQSTPYPLWDPANGGTGFADREDFAIRSKGKIKITQAGVVWFNCNSDDGFDLRIDGTSIGSAPNRARADSVMSVDLTAGVHDLEIVHWERGGGAGVSVLVYRAITADAPAVSGNTWQLIEAAPTTPVSTLSITSFTYNQATSILNLTFTSQVGSTYRLEYTIGFQPAGAPASASKWHVVPSHASIAGAADTTSITPLNTTSLVTPGGQLPNNSQVYFRVVKN